MFCPNCGSQISDGSKFCMNCGASFEAPPQPQQQQQPPQQQQQPPQQQYQQQQYQQQQYQQRQQYQQQLAPQYQQAAAGQSGVGFIGAIKLFFVNYVNFRGRATRSEYWWAMLFVAIAYTTGALFWFTIVIPVAVYFGLVVPCLSITIRRFHDIGKNWPVIFMSLIPFAGSIIMIVFCCQASVGDNEWGPGPYTSSQRV